MLHRKEIVLEETQKIALDDVLVSEPFAMPHCDNETVKSNIVHDRDVAIETEEVDLLPAPLFLDLPQVDSLLGEDEGIDASGNDENNHHHKAVHEGWKHGVVMNKAHAHPASQLSRSVSPQLITGNEKLRNRVGHAIHQAILADSSQTNFFNASNHASQTESVKWSPTEQNSSNQMGAARESNELSINHNASLPPQRATSPGASTLALIRDSVNRSVAATAAAEGGLGPKEALPLKENLATLQNVGLALGGSSAVSGKQQKVDSGALQRGCAAFAESPSRAAWGLKTSPSQEAVPGESDAHSASTQVSTPQRGLGPSCLIASPRRMLLPSHSLVSPVLRAGRGPSAVSLPWGSPCGGSSELASTLAVQELISLDTAAHGETALPGSRTFDEGHRQNEKTPAGRREDFHSTDTAREGEHDSIACRHLLGETQEEGSCSSGGGAAHAHALAPHALPNPDPKTDLFMECGNAADEVGGPLCCSEVLIPDPQTRLKLPLQRANPCEKPASSATPKSPRLSAPQGDSCLAKSRKKPFEVCADAPLRFVAGMRVEGRWARVWYPAVTTETEHNGFVQIRWDSDGSLVHLKVQEVRLATGLETGLEAFKDAKANPEGRNNKLGHVVNPKRERLDVAADSHDRKTHSPGPLNIDLPPRDPKEPRRKREGDPYSHRPTTGTQLVQLMCEEDEVEEQLWLDCDDEIARERSERTSGQNSPELASTELDTGLVALGGPPRTNPVTGAQQQRSRNICDSGKTVGRGGGEFTREVVSPRREASSAVEEQAAKDPRKTEVHAVELATAGTPELPQIPKGSTSTTAACRSAETSRLCIYFSRSARRWIGWDSCTPLVRQRVERRNASSRFRSISLSKRVELLRKQGASILESPEQLSALLKCLNDSAENPSEEVRGTASSSLVASQSPRKCFSSLFIYLVAGAASESPRGALDHLSEHHHHPAGGAGDGSKEGGDGDADNDVYEALALGVVPVHCAWLEGITRGGSVSLPTKEYLAFPKTISLSWDSQAHPPGGGVSRISDVGDATAWLTLTPHAERFLSGKQILFTGPDEGMERLVRAAGGTVVQSRCALHGEAASPLDYLYLPPGARATLEASLATVPLLDPSWLRGALAIHCCGSSLPSRRQDPARNALASPMALRASSPLSSLLSPSSSSGRAGITAAEGSPTPLRLRSASVLLCGTADHLRGSSPPHPPPQGPADHHNEEEGEEKREQKRGKEGEEAARRIDWGPFAAAPPVQVRRRSRTTSSPAIRPAGPRVTALETTGRYPPVVVGEDYYFRLPNGEGESNRDRGVAPIVALGRVVALAELPSASQESLIASVSPPFTAAMVTLQLYEVKHSFLQQNPCTNALERQTAVSLSPRRSIVPIDSLLFDTPVYVVHASSMQHIYILDSNDAEDIASPVAGSSFSFPLLPHMGSNAATPVPTLGDT